MPKSEFIGEKIEVYCAKKPYPPTSFVWRGTEYRIKKIEAMKRKLDFQKSWWRRRHRDYYWVRTDTGELFELYFHRGPGRKYWVLYSRDQQG